MARGLEAAREEQELLHQRCRDASRKGRGLVRFLEIVRAVGELGADADLAVVMADAGDELPVVVVRIAGRRVGVGVPVVHGLRGRRGVLAELEVVARRQVDLDARVVGCLVVEVDGRCPDVRKGARRVVVLHPALQGRVTVRLADAAETIVRREGHAGRERTPRGVFRLGNRCNDGHRKDAQQSRLQFSHSHALPRAFFKKLSCDAAERVRRRSAVSMVRIFGVAAALKHSLG